MKLRIEPSVAVIVPTVGSEKLKKCLDSIDAQTYGNLAIIIVSDCPPLNGAIHIYDIVDNSSYNKETQVIYLPYNTGGNGYYGHRIYASIPHLLNQDYIFFLDEDNWYEPSHVDDMVRTFQDNPEAQFVHSLRNICGEDTEFLCQDNCESLGAHPVWFNEMEHLVDTSTYAFRRDFIQQTCGLWHFKWGGDRRFFYSVKGTPFACTGKYTVNYRLDGNPNSVKVDFFLKGNDVMKAKYNGVFPWVKH